MSRIPARLWASRRPLLRAATPAIARVAPSSYAVAGRSLAGPSRASAGMGSFSAPQARAFHASPRALGTFHFKLHDIGEGITEVEMIKWHIKEGDVVDEFDSLCEVQSDKSVVEITSPHAGKVAKLSAATGSVVKVGMTLCEIETDAVEGSEEAEAAPEPAPEPAAAPPPPRREAAPAAPAPTPTPAPAAPAPEAPSRKVPREPRPHPLSDTAVRFHGEASVLPAAPPPSRDAIPDSVEARRDGTAQAKHIVRASPAVRAFAGRLGVELEECTPTGPSGRVVREDVERAAGVGAHAPPAAPARAPSPASPAPAAPRAAAPAARAPEPAPVFSAVDRGDEVERMEMGRTRKVMYKAMGSMGDVPHFGYVHTLNLTNLLPLMKAANAAPSEPKGYIAADVPQSLVHPAPTPARQKTSVLAFLVKALSLALEEHPIMRSRVREADGHRWLDVSRDANIGIAVSDPKLGLLTPSLPPIEPGSSVSTIAGELANLRDRAARPGPLPHITLSSVGGLGESRGAMPVLPPGGGLAIAAVGRAAWEMEWNLRDGAPGKGNGGVWGVEPAQVEKAGPKAVLRATVGWSGDHRVLEGAELIAFTETWKRFVEEPWRWIHV